MENTVTKPGFRKKVSREIRTFLQNGTCNCNTHYDTEWYH